MKKILSLVLILAMALCMFAGCDDQPTEPAGNGLEDAKTYLYAMYKDNAEITAVDFKVVGVVMIDNVSYNVTWTVDNDAIKITAADKFFEVDVPDTLEEITYTLTATISDAEGNTVTQSFTYKVPAAAGLPTSIADGTYVILACGNLTMSSLSEDKGYGYPYATEVVVADGTVSGHTAADVLTITNVEGGVTIQDAYGRYFYLKGTYNSFNVSAEAPAEGHVWEVLKNGNDYIIVNAMNKKTLAYSTSYTSWGAYPELTADHNSLLNIIAAEAPAPHVHVEVVDAAVAATCTTDGLTEGKHCSDCGEVLVAQEVITAPGHTPAAAVQENVVGGGCGEAGSYEEVITCTVCGEEISRTTVEIPATGDHNYITEIARQDATCTEAGFVTMACSCGAEQTTELPAGHTEAEAVKENEVAASIAGNGGYDSVVYCTACGAEVSRETVEVAGGVQIGVAYKIFLNHETVGKGLYFTGKTANKDYYLATSESIEDAVDVFFEEVEGGYRIYFMVGETKMYIDAYLNGSYQNARLTENPTAVFTVNEEHATLVATIEDGNTVYIGAYSTYTTFSVSKVSYLGSSGSFSIQFIVA